MLLLSLVLLGHTTVSSTATTSSATIVLLLKLPLLPSLLQLLLLPLLLLLLLLMLVLILQQLQLYHDLLPIIIIINILTNVHCYPSMIALPMMRKLCRYIASSVRLSAYSIFPFRCICLSVCRCVDRYLSPSVNFSYPFMFLRNNYAYI